ncbi:hypothetical protein [Parasediminibacterium sp. JCM 36343]|uniref:hypothetical protein n=1 Tax=Parasediminibacterium sp. JCM 36343 TaxID=3374279 RepID=UPI00397AD8B8
MMRPFLAKCKTWAWVALYILVCIIGNKTYGQTTSKTQLKDSTYDIVQNDSGISNAVAYFAARYSIVKHVVDKKSGLDNIYVKLGWKEYRVLELATPIGHSPVDAPARAKAKNKGIPLLRIHGNVLYSLDYRSSIDTPYAEKDIYQHTVQAYMDITVKDKYPIRFYVTNRFSNSGFFKNFSALNFQFNQQQFNQQLKGQMKAAIPKNPLAADTGFLHTLLQNKSLELSSLQAWLKNPATLQKLVEAREAALLKVARGKLLGKADTLGSNKLPNTGFPTIATLANLAKDSLMPHLANKDTTDNAKNGNIADRYKQKKGRVDSLGAKVGKLTKLYQQLKGKNYKDISQAGIDSIGKKGKKDTSDPKIETFTEEYARKKQWADSLQGQIASLKQQYKTAKQIQLSDSLQQGYAIDNITNAKQLQAKMKELHMSDSSLPKGYRQLFAIRSFGIGRNMLDYSELTAKSISVNGVQVEYNPSYYVAVATGSVDYRFRDLVVGNGGPKQYATILRVGEGMKEGSHLFLSYYFGNRQLYNSSTTVQGTTIPNGKLMGYSVEGQWKPNKGSSIIGEFAKSSFPYYYQENAKASLLSGSFRYSDRSNEAWSIQASSFLPRTATKLGASYKHYGSNFQSFSVFTTGSSQTNWGLKAEQPFWKRKLTVVASVHTNDFVNPYIGSNFKSSTVFKSIQATLRVRKWPTVSVSYSPSSQLVKLSGGQYSENTFYTLCANATHFYQYKGLGMNSTLVYSRFYNKSPDSGFVYFNTKNLLFSQNITSRKWSYQANMTVSANTDYTLYTVENNCQYRAKQWLSVGAGVKYNGQPKPYTVLFGYSANATVTISKLGEFQLMADKGFIPGSNRQLVSNNIGRLSYFKTF